MCGSVVAGVRHSPDNRALLLETLPLLEIVLPQVDLKIPGKEEAWVSPGTRELQLRPQSWLWQEVGVAWCRQEPSGLPPSGLPSSGNDNPISPESPL